MKRVFPFFKFKRVQNISNHSVYTGYYNTEIFIQLYVEER